MMMFFTMFWCFSAPNQDLNSKSRFKKVQPHSKRKRHIYFVHYLKVLSLSRIADFQFHLMLMVQVWVYGEQCCLYASFTQLIPPNCDQQSSLSFDCTVRSRHTSRIVIILWFGNSKHYHMCTILWTHRFIWQLIDSLCYDVDVIMV